MPAMTIRVTNATFDSADTGDYPTLDDAYRAAVLAGLKIAADEVAAGSSSVIVQVAVDVADRHQAARGAVAVSTARLLNDPSA